MPEVSRRAFLGRAGLAAGGIAAGGAGLGLLTACADSNETQNGAPEAAPLDPRDWDSVRAQFSLSHDLLQFSAFVLASPPRQVSEAIASHRTGLDQDTVGYLGNEAELDGAVIEEAANYLETDRGLIALTDSTTMGLGLVYGGLRMSPGQEVLTTEHDFYYATHEALRLRTERDGIAVRKILLYTTIRRRPPSMRSPLGWARRSRRSPAQWQSPGCTRAPAVRSSRDWLGLGRSRGLDAG